MTSVPNQLVPERASNRLLVRRTAAKTSAATSGHPQTQQEWETDLGNDPTDSEKSASHKDLSSEEEEEVPIETVGSEIGSYTNIVELAVENRGNPTAFLKTNKTHRQLLVHSVYHNKAMEPQPLLKEKTWQLVIEELAKSGILCKTTKTLENSIKDELKELLRVERLCGGDQNQRTTGNETTLEGLGSEHTRNLEAIRDGLEEYEQDKNLGVAERERKAAKKRGENEIADAQRLQGLNGGPPALTTQRGAAAVLPTARTPGSGNNSRSQTPASGRSTPVDTQSVLIRDMHSDVQASLQREALWGNRLPGQVDVDGEDRSRSASSGGSDLSKLTAVISKASEAQSEATKSENDRADKRLRTEIEDKAVEQTREDKRLNSEIANKAMEIERLKASDASNAEVELLKARNESTRIDEVEKVKAQTDRLKVEADARASDANMKNTTKQLDAQISLQSRQLDMQAAAAADAAQGRTDMMAFFSAIMKNNNNGGGGGGGGGGVL